MGHERGAVLVRALAADDEPWWRELWTAYNHFYDTDVPEFVTARTLKRLLDPGSALVGRVALLNGEVVGFSASVIHEATWDIRPVCYLEDLFVSEVARGFGVGRALIDDLLDLARQSNWGRLYWHTRSDNWTARRLYDHYVPADDFVRYRLIL
ncbi:MAG: GNAT family N-acetyltransferase [Hyphomicrobiaceae bacterium]|nr:GNAT family N-acetyltransferase [Hyphomicrobiaceae bacterium]